jgi:hypothetical protein
MQFRVEALPTSQVQPTRNPPEGQRRLLPQPRGDRQFDRKGEKEKGVKTMV